MVKPRENRVPIMLSDEELEAIEAWRFNNRIGTRSEAIRRLAKIGILTDDWIIDAERFVEAAMDKFLDVFAKDVENPDKQAAVNEVFSALSFTWVEVAKVTRASFALRKTGDIEDALSEAEWVRSAAIEEKIKLYEQDFGVVRKEPE